MHYFPTLIRLQEFPCVSGYAYGFLPPLQKLCEGLFDSVSVTPAGSLLCMRHGVDARKTILLDAHMDSPGFMVSMITPNGFLKVQKIGISDNNLLPSLDVMVYGKQPIRGVFASKPPHIMTPEERAKAIGDQDLLIDVGFTEAEAEEHIQIGDLVTFSPCVTLLQNGYVSATGLSSRLGILSLLHCAQLVQHQTLPFHAACLFSTGYHTNNRGISSAIYLLNPDMLISLDACPAAFPDIDKRLLCQTEHGPVIHVCDAHGLSLSNALIDCAKENGISHQIMASPSGVCSQSDRAFTSFEGVPTAVVSLPMRNLHSPHETACLTDAEQTARLLASFVLHPEKAVIPCK